MNANLERHYRDVVLPYRELRDQLLEALTDDDLGFRPSSRNLTLGGLCVRLGETQRTYTESFKTFKAQFAFDAPDAERSTSVAGLKAWYKELDAEFYAALDGISDEDAANRPIDRGFMVPVFIHLDIYREGLLIFCGKISVYLDMMGKELPGKWGSWIWL